MQVLDVNTKLKTSALWTGGMHSAKCKKRQIFYYSIYISSFPSLEVYLGIRNISYLFQFAVVTYSTILVDLKINLNQSVDITLIYQ
jgi:hypothetical protein